MNIEKKSIEQVDSEKY